jgi:hypothetical protein
MPYRDSTRSDDSFPSCPSRGTVRAFGSRWSGPASLVPRLSASGCLTRLACLGPTMPSADFCRMIRAAPATLSPSRDSRQISQGKAQNVSRVGAGLIQHTTVRMEDVAVIPPVAGLVPGGPTSRLSGIPVRRPGRLDWASSSPHRSAELTPKPRNAALALLLDFGSASTWREDSPLACSVSGLTHMIKMAGRLHASAPLASGAVDRRVGRERNHRKRHHSHRGGRTGGSPHSRGQASRNERNAPPPERS